jgi:hypothetical protein
MSLDYRNCINFALPYLPINPIVIDVGCNIDPIVEIEHLHLGENAQVIEKMFFEMGYTHTNSLHPYDWSFIRN